MNIENWSYVYKVKEGEQQSTNILYTPLMNPEGTILCMSWDETDPYQHYDNPKKEVVDFFFKREVANLTMFQQYSWAPRILEIDEEKQRIFIEWNNESINAILNTPGRNLDEECPTWKEQIFTILQDIVSAGYYKMALYPHCFFIDKNNQIKTFDYYSCLSIEERYLDRSVIAGVIGTDSIGRFQVATVGDKIDFEIFFKNTLTQQLEKTWFHYNPFPEFYSKLFPSS